MSRCLEVAKCIEDMAVDLQSSAVEAELEAFEEMAVRHKMGVEYDYPSRGFLLSLSKPISAALPSYTIHLRSIWV